MEKEKPSPLRPETLLLSWEVLCSFPCLGTVLSVTTGESFEDVRHLQDGHHWVKLYNVSCGLQSEIWRGVMSLSSKIFILSDEDSNVKYRKR